MCFVLVFRYVIIVAFWASAEVDLWAGEGAIAWFLKIWPTQCVVDSRDILFRMWREEIGVDPLAYREWKVQER